MSRETIHKTYALLIFIAGAAILFIMPTGAEKIGDVSEVLLPFLHGRLPEIIFLLIATILSFILVISYIRPKGLFFVSLDYSIGFLLLFVSGAFWASVIMSLSVSFKEFRRRETFSSFVLAENIGNRILRTYAFDIVYTHLGGNIPLHVIEKGDLLPILFAFIGFVLANNLLFLPSDIFLKKVGKGYFRSIFIYDLPASLLNISLGIIMAIIWWSGGFITLLLLFALLVFISNLLESDFKSRERLGQRVKELDLLRSVTAEISQDLDLDKIIAKLYPSLQSLVKYQGIYLAVLEPSKELFQLRIYEGERIRHWRKKVSTDFLLKEVINAEIPEDTKLYTLFNRAVGGIMEKPASWAAYPFSQGGTISGGIALYDSRQGIFTPNIKRVLATLSNQIALIVDNAFLYERSIKDSLTGLYMRHYFEGRLEEVIALSQRQKKEFCLLMADLDNFKAANDTHGHLAGDNILIRTAEIFRNILRKSDIPCRYGGDEFIVLLPDTDIEGSRQLAKRIQSQLQRETFSDITGSPILLTVSMGMLLWKQGISEEPKKLIEDVDRALYLAKSMGKNQIFASK